jgi:hypothetical protein
VCGFQLAGWVGWVDVVGLERVIESWAVTADVADGCCCSYLCGALSVVARVLTGLFFDLIAFYVVKFDFNCLVVVTKITEREIAADSAWLGESAHLAAALIGRVKTFTFEFDCDTAQHLVHRA